MVPRIEALRREKKWSARLIASEPTEDGVDISATTVGRWLSVWASTGAGTWTLTVRTTALRARSPPTTPGT